MNTAVTSARCQTSNLHFCQNREEVEKLFFFYSRSFSSKTLFKYYIISAVFVLFVSFFPITGNKIKFKKKHVIFGP
jgi:hypothetical protein